MSDTPGAGGERGLPVYVAADPAGSLISIRVIPRAARTSLAGERGGALLVRLAAPPVDGAANEALLEYLAESLKVSRRWLTLVNGQHSRAKRVRVAGLTPRELADRLTGLSG
jgi:uncharacterized protein (TIGR00251 family)